MTVLLDEVMKKMPKEQQILVDERYKILCEEVYTLQELRKAQELTQIRMAEILDTKQGSISKIEKRSDMKLSTLQNYIEAMGGSLELTVSFPNRKPVSLIGLLDDSR